MKGTLWLIPNVLDDGEPSAVIPEPALDQVRKLRYFIVENERNARRFLVKAGMKLFLDEIQWGLLNEHTRADELMPLIQPLLSGTDAGLLSESGCPGIADPGAEVVRMAHESNIRVKPLAGPSSITLALMSSGLNGQTFAFHGYLPVKPRDRIRKIREIEQRSRNNRETQIFIEAPYRNQQLLLDLVNTLNPDVLLSVSADLTAPSELIRTAPVWQWQGHLPVLNKRPAVFMILYK